MAYNWCHAINIPRIRLEFDINKVVYIESAYWLHTYMSKNRTEWFKESLMSEELVQTF